MIPPCLTLSNIKYVSRVKWNNPENHAVRFRQSAENCSQARDMQPIRSIGTPWLLEEDMERRSPLSEYMSPYPSLTHQRNINPFENEVSEIYFYKKCVHLFIEVRKLCLIMFPLIFVLQLYNTSFIKKLQTNIVFNSVKFGSIYIQVFLEFLPDPFPPSIFNDK